MTGRRLLENLSHFHFWLNFTGVSLALTPFYSHSPAGMPRRYYDYDRWEYLRLHIYIDQLFSVVGWVVLIFQVGFFINLVYSAFRGRKLGR